MDGVVATARLSELFLILDPSQIGALSELSSPSPRRPYAARTLKGAHARETALEHAPPQQAHPNFTTPRIYARSGAVTIYSQDSQLRGGFDVNSETRVGPARGAALLARVEGGAAIVAVRA